MCTSGKPYEMAIDMMKHTEADGVVNIIVVQSGEGSQIQLLVAVENGQQGGHTHLPSPHPTYELPV